MIPFTQATQQGNENQQKKLTKRPLQDMLVGLSCGLTQGILGPRFFDALQDPTIPVELQVLGGIAYTATMINSIYLAGRGYIQMVRDRRWEKEHIRTYYTSN